MRSFNKKGVGYESEKLVDIILVVVALVVITFIIIAFYADFNVKTMKTYGCWVGNGMMASNPLFRSMLPVTCKQQIVEESMTKAELSTYLTDVWFMYGQGDWDFHTKHDDSIQVAIFKLKEDVKLRDLFLHMLTHAGTRQLSQSGRIELKDLSESDYNYLQKGSEGQTLCLHENLIDKTMGEAVLKRDKIYYIYIWDDISGVVSSRDSGDKIILADKALSSSDIDGVGCCTLRQGKCQTLSGSNWLDYPDVLANFVVSGAWETPGQVKEETGGLFQ